MTDFDLGAWHAANVGLHGDDPRLASLLYPYRPLAQAIADLRWTDAHGNRVSNCGIYGIAYVRARGVRHPAVVRDYRNGEAPIVLPQIARDLGALATGEELLAYPDPGDVLWVDEPWHVVCVTGSDGPSGNLLAVEGGGGDDRSWIKAHAHPVTARDGKLWLSDPAWGAPRAIMGRLVASRLVADTEPAPPTDA